MRLAKGFVAMLAGLAAAGAASAEIDPAARTLASNRAVIDGTPQLPVAVATSEYVGRIGVCLLPPGQPCGDAATYLAVYRGGQGVWLVRKSFGGEFAVWASSAWCPQMTARVSALAGVKSGGGKVGGNDVPSYQGLDLDPKFNPAPAGNSSETLDTWIMATEEALAKCWRSDPDKPPVNTAPARDFIKDGQSDQAIPLLNAAISKGQMGAASLLADVYFHRAGQWAPIGALVVPTCGPGPNNPEKGFAALKAGAQKGDGGAMLVLAVNYKAGGCLKDMNQSVYWYETSDWRGLSPCPHRPTHPSLPL